jgi:RNA polymerase sigma factor (TIGR02999 family)
VPQSSSNQVTALLAKWKAGDELAFEALVPLVYNELRQVAHRYLRHERPDHTLQTTALVHETYLRLIKQGGNDFENRAHFLAISAQLMRQVLVEYARHRNAAKRDARKTVTLDAGIGLFNSRCVDVMALDDALKDLAVLDARQSRIVELRFFGGLSTEEIAAVLGISSATVKREWATAKVWLYHEISKAESV